MTNLTFHALILFSFIGTLAGLVLSIALIMLEKFVRARNILILSGACFAVFIVLAVFYSIIN